MRSEPAAVGEAGIMDGEDLAVAVYPLSLLPFVPAGFDSLESELGETGAYILWLIVQLLLAKG